MPVALSTRFTHPISLPLDKEIVEAERPTFHVRFINEIQKKEIADAINGNPPEAWEVYRERLQNAILPLIAEIRNFPPDIKSPAEAMTILQHEEMSDLGFEILRTNEVGYAELKKYKLQQASGAA